MYHSCQILFVKSVRFTINNTQIKQLYSQFLHNFSPGLVKNSKRVRSVRLDTEKSEIWEVWSESVRLGPKA